VKDLRVYLDVGDVTEKTPDTAIHESGKAMSAIACHITRHNCRLTAGILHRTKHVSF
jgi:hypothetical protein